MKTVTFTDFRKQASTYLTEVEQGEMFVVLRHGKPIAEIIPVTENNDSLPAWKQPADRLQIPGSDLSSAIVEDRENGS